MAENEKQPSSDPNAHAGKGGLFVRRPVLAIVFSLLIVVAGIAGILGGEIRELPDVDRPVISISTNYTGAAPETIDREVTSIIEGGVARVSGVTDISSSSSFGRSRVTVEFSDSTDLSAAAADVRDAIGRVTRNLPDDADDPQIVKADANAQPVMRLAVTSETMSVQDMTVLVEDEVVDRIASVPGVADVQVYGDREKIFRIDIDQTRLAALGLTVGNLKTTLNNVAYDVPAGTLTATTQDIVVRATADVTTPEEFEALYLNDRVRIGDVANVTLGPDPGDSTLRANGKTGIGLGIIRQAKSNTLEISQGVRQAAADLQQILPDGVDIRVTGDDATFISGAIDEVVRSLLIATGVVVLIIFIFLLDWRATIIPAVTLPVALIGTFAAIYLMGFSINILTLLALVLATGMVVDDAIVVLENIVRKRNEGLGIRAGCRYRHERGVFRRHCHHRHARRGLHSALLPAGPGRKPLPGIRLRAGLLGSALELRGADALPYACLQDHQGQAAARRRSGGKARGIRPFRKPAFGNLSAAFAHGARFSGRRGAHRRSGLRHGVCPSLIRATGTHPARRPRRGADEHFRTARREPRIYLGAHA